MVTLARGESRQRRNYFRDEWFRRILCVEAWHGHSELGAAALLKAVWWDLHLASLLTHLLLSLSSRRGFLSMYTSSRWLGDLHFSMVKS